MSTELNMEYQEVKFCEIAKHISKRVEPSETTLEIYVGLEHLNPDSLKITRHGVPSDVAGQKLLVKKGQIIFGKRRAYQRKVAVADWDCICSAHAMVLEAIPGKIMPEFLPFFMQSNQFMERAVEISEGSLSPTIKWKILEQQVFKIPTLKFQENFIQILNKVEKCLDITALSLISAKKLYVEYNDLLFGYKENDLNYKSLKLADLAKIDNGYAFKSTEFSESKLIPVIRISDIKTDGTVDSQKSVKVDYHKDLKKFETNPGDILIAMSGATTGKTGVYIGSKAYLNQRVGRFSFLDDKTNKNIIIHLLKNDSFQNSMLVDAAGGAQPNISPSSIEKTKLKILRNLDNVNQVLSILDDLDKEIKALNLKSLILINLKNSLFDL